MWLGTTPGPSPSNLFNLNMLLAVWKRHQHGTCVNVASFQRTSTMRCRASYDNVNTKSLQLIDFVTKSISHSECVHGINPWEILSMDSFSKVFKLQVILSTESNQRAILSNLSTVSITPANDCVHRIKSEWLCPRAHNWHGFSQTLKWLCEFLYPN